MRTGLSSNLDFGEYEQIYNQWCKGELLMEDLVRRYGREVSEMVQAQYILGMELDGGDGQPTQLDDTVGKSNEGDI